MRGRKTSIIIVLTPEELSEIEHLMRSSTAPAGLVRRSRAIFAVSQGNTLKGAAQVCGMTVMHVWKWCKRFVQAPQAERMAALRDRPGRGRKPRLSPPGKVEHH